MFIETIRLSQQAKDQLTWLKRWTKLKNWNVLCRWALCTSLAESTCPPPAKIPGDSSVEMSWRVFGGDHASVYALLMRQRCNEDGLGTDDETLAEQFRLHLHRGIAYLAADKKIRSIDGLFERIPGLS